LLKVRVSTEVGDDSGRNQATVEATVDGVAWRVSQLTTTIGAAINPHP